MLQKQISGIGDRKSEKKSVSDRQSAAFIVGQCLKDALGVSSGLVLAYRPIDSKNEDGVLAIVGQSDNGINSIYNRLKNNIDGLLPGTIQIEDDDGWYLLVSLDYDDLIFGCVVLGPKPDHKKFSSNEENQISSLRPMASQVLLGVDLTLGFSPVDVGDLVTRAVEAEWAKLAGDLHDGPLQKALMLGGFGANVHDPVAMARLLSDELREICGSLQPTVLKEFGIAAGLDWLLDWVGEQYHIKTNLSLEGIEFGKRLLPDVELALFRVALEASNNTIKHAQASKLDFRVKLQKKWALLIVQDDGIGFDAQNISISNSRMGISGMLKRAQQLGGDITIDSVKEKGTKVSVKIPRTSSGNQGSLF